MWRPNIGSDVLMHSRGPWKKHKYIKVVDGQYIYPESMGAEMRRRHTQETEARIDNYERLEAEKAKRDEAARERKVNAVNTTRAAQRRGMERTERINAAKKEEARRNKRNAIKSAQTAQNRGYDQTARVRQQRANQLREERNAEGRSAVKRQLSQASAKAAGNRAERNIEGRKAAKAQINAANANVAGRKRIAAEEANKRRKIKSDNVNAGNLARARRKAKNAQLREERNAAGRLSARKQITEGNRKARLRDQRNAEGRIAARKQIAEGNRKARLRDQRNAEGRIAARKQGVKLNDIAKKSTSLRMGSKARYAQRSGDKAGAERYIKQKRIADKVYTEGLRRDYFGRDAILKKKDPNKLPARLDVAAKQAGNAISREAYRTGYKAKKAAKSISAKAQAAWNNSASYREQFADYKSFLNWYKKNRK